MNRAVIDASAMIAFLRRETGFEAVSEWMNGACISAVNFAEVLQKLTDNPHEESMLNALVINMGISVIDFDRDQAAGVARLYPDARKGISLADRVCLGLGIQESLPVVTGDRDWGNLNIDAEVIVFRPKVN